VEIDIATGAAVLTVVSKKYGTFRVLIDAADFDRVSRHKWSVLKPNKKYDLVYFITGVRKPDGKQTTMSLHRFLMGEPVKLVVDHKNPNNTLDNRRCNLRIATHQENGQNSRPHRNATSSRFKGVSWEKHASKWRAYIMVDGHRTHLGYRDSEIEAAKLYDAAAIEHFGEFAFLNFPIEIAEIAA
jgi:hypothetical protein